MPHGMEDPSQRLQYARIKAGHATATAAAKAYGWNVNTYRSHENAERGLRPKVLRQYAKAFHVSPGWLATGEGTAPGPMTSGSPQVISVDPEDVRKMVALVLRAQGTEPDLAADLADIVVESLATPPLASVDGDLTHQLQVRLELQSRRSASLKSR